MHGIPNIYLQDRSTCVASVPDGYFSGDGNILEKCSPNCKTCSDATTCTACSTGYLSGGKCFSLTAAQAEKDLAGKGTQITYSAGTSTRGDTTCHTTAVDAYRLTDVTKTSSINGAKVTVVVGKTDMDILKSMLTLSVSKPSTFLAASKEAIEDMRTNDVVALPSSVVCPNPCFGVCACSIANLGVSTFTADGTDPAVASVDVDMDGNGKLTVVFSETVKELSIKTDSLTLQSTETSDGATETVTLSGKLSVTKVSHTTYTIVPSVADMNKIKQKRKLCIGKDSCYMVVATSFATDNTNNKVEDIPSSKGQVANAYKADATDPTLTGFELDMDKGEMKLTFDETVDAATFKVKQLTLQASADAPANARYELTEKSTPSKVDETIITVSLTLKDMNAIKRNTKLCTEKTSTYLTITTAAVKDTAGNTVTAVTNGKATGASKFTADTTSPTLQSYELNLQADTITMQFSETVKASSIVGSKLTLQSSQTSSAVSLLLAFKSNPEQDDSDTLTLTLTVPNSNAIKKLASLATSDASTFLAVDPKAVTDMNAREVVEIKSSAAQKVKTFTKDSSAPAITQADLNMNTGKLTLTFSETVSVGLLDPEKIFIQNANAAQKVKLSKESSSKSTDGTVVVIDLAVKDTNAIKAFNELATRSKDDAYVSVTKGAIQDMTSIDVDAKVVQVTTFTKDTSVPKLVQFDLDMNTKKLELRFSETVDGRTLSPEALTFFNGKTVSTAPRKVKLTGGTYTNTPSDTLTVDITPGDANEIKALTDLCSEKTNTYLVIAQDAVKDMRGNAIPKDSLGADTAMQATKHTPDSGKPTLKSFEAVMPTGKPPMKLILKFSEAVDVASLKTDQIVLYDDESKTKKLPLTAGDATKALVKGSLTDIEVTVADKDLVSMRALESVGRTQAATLIELNAGSVADHVPNAIATMAKPIVSSKHTVDVTPPTVSGLAVDFATNTITISFSEDIETTKFDVENVQLQSKAADATVKYVLRGGKDGKVVAGSSKKDVVIELTQTDVNAIKALRLLAKDQASTFVVLPTGALVDVAQNPSVAVANTKAFQATAYTKDGVLPKLKTFTLDMTDGIMKFTFDEIMDVASVKMKLGEMKLQNKDKESTAQSAALAGTASGTDGTIITVTLDVPSANAVRAVPALATDKASTFITFSTNFITDVDGNGVVAAPDTAAVQATEFVGDSKPPLATGFTIDMTAGSMEITFEKPVDGSKVEMKQLQLQSTKDASNGVAVALPASTASTALSLKVTVTFDATELNNIKRAALCTKTGGTSSCFLSFSDTFVKDATGLAVKAVAANSGLASTKYDADATDPVITAKVGFEKFDLNLGRITLAFSEVIDQGVV